VALAAGGGDAEQQHDALSILLRRYLPALRAHLTTSAEALAGLGYVEARLRQSAEAQRHAALAVLQAGNDYLILHNVACIYSRLADNNLSTARAHEDAAIALLARAVQIWRTTRSGPSELELVQLEAAFGTSLRARAEFRALQQ
jgi:hypothetical protein